MTIAAQRALRNQKRDIEEMAKILAKQKLAEQRAAISARNNLMSAGTDNVGSRVNTSNASALGTGDHSVKSRQLILRNYHDY
jgi:hypothetical protein